MPIPVHLICGKCGSLDIEFRIGEPCTDEDAEDCGVNTHCKKCATLTSVESINEWKEDQLKKLTNGFNVPVNLICGKCGSGNTYFEIGERYEDNCGVYISCENCCTITGVEQVNEWKEEQKKKISSGF